MTFRTRRFIGGTMADIITIDGSFGEGGGQILRSSLALSIVTGKPFRIERIRANRPKPGLMRQHLASVNAAAEICGGSVSGAELGSRTLSFFPGKVRAGDYTFNIGSAGSTTLVLQTVLPALILADAPSTVVLEGGTHNIHAPPLDFLEYAFLPIMRKLGPQVHVALERAGFYPAGGGRFFATIEPVKSWSPIDLDVRGEIQRRLCCALVAGLPGDIAKREVNYVRQKIGWDESCVQIRQLSDDQGPGNVVTIQLHHEHVTEVFTGFGQRGVSAESVAQEAALDQAARYMEANVPVGKHLADQLIIPFAARGPRTVRHACALGAHADEY